MNTTLLVSFTILASLGFSDTVPPPKEEKAEETIRIVDQLLPGDALDRMSNAPHKVHIVRLPAGKIYLVTMIRKDNSQALNPFLRIEDSEFKQLAPFAVRIKFTLPKDDEYRFIATGNGSGEYVLKIAPFNSATIKKHEPGKVHDVGKDGIEYESTIAGTDAKYVGRTGSFAKVFEVNLTKDRTYTIDMESTQFDAYLFLENSERQVLAQDDDSGGNLNARILFQAPADGVYRIITTTFAQGASGTFTLRQFSRIDRRVAEMWPGSRYSVTPEYRTGSSVLPWVAHP